MKVPPLFTPAALPNAAALPRTTAARLFVVICCLVAWLPLVGCKSGPRPLDQARQDYYLGNFAASRTQFENLTERDRRLRDVAQLDLAIVELAAGNAARADALLRDSRDTFDDRQASITMPTATTLLTDDRDSPYDAAGYEDVMIRSLLSITSLISGSGDAEAYALQAQMKQGELAQQAAERGLENVGQVYQPLALSPYIRGVLRESSHHDYGDAERAYQLVAQWEPEFAFAAEDVQRASSGTHSQPGYGVLYVFALVGRGPIRVEDYAEASGSALLIADRIVAASSDLAIPPTLAPIPVPRVVVPASNVQTVGVRVNGVASGTTARLADVGRLATRQAEAELPWTIARGVVRRVAKKAVVTTGAKSISGNSAGVEQGLALLGSLWEATEHADTRCWSLLPREIQVLRVELPVGKHQVSTAALGSRIASTPVTASITIRDGRNAYLLVVAPDDRVTAMTLPAE